MAYPDTLRVEMPTDLASLVARLLIELGVDSVADFAFSLANDAAVAQTQRALPAVEMDDEEADGYEARRIRNETTRWDGHGDS